MHKNNSSPKEHEVESTVIGMMGEAVEKDVSLVDTFRSLRLNQFSIHYLVRRIGHMLGIRHMPDAHAIDEMISEDFSLAQLSRYLEDAA